MGKGVFPGGCFGNSKLLISKIAFWSCPLEKPGVEEGSRLSAVYGGFGTKGWLTNFFSPVRAHLFDDQIKAQQVDCKRH